MFEQENIVVFILFYFIFYFLFFNINNLYPGVLKTVRRTTEVQ